MHDPNIWLEKLSHGHYRVHIISKGPEQIAENLTNGCSVSPDNPNEFIKDYSIEDSTLNFGVTMADCFNQLLNNQCFISAYIHLRSLRTFSAITRKKFVDNLQGTEVLEVMLETLGLDGFLFAFAENYSDSLVEEASVYLDKGLTEFEEWLRSDSMVFKNDPKDVPDDYAIDRNNISQDLCIHVYIGCGEASLDPKKYEEWKDKFDNDEYWEVFFSNPADESQDIGFYFACYYYFSSNKAVEDLFEILSEKEAQYSKQVKRLIYNVLTSCCRKDADFARDIQLRYNEYRTINGGVDITFETTTAEDANKVQQLTQTVDVDTNKDDGNCPIEVVSEESKLAIEETINQKARRLVGDLLPILHNQLNSGYSQKKISNFFNDILIKERRSIPEQEAQKTIVRKLFNNRSKYEYQGLKVIVFCRIVGYLLSEKVGILTGDPNPIAEKLQPYLTRTNVQNGEDPNAIENLRTYIQKAKLGVIEPPGKSLIDKVLSIKES